MSAVISAHDDMHMCGIDAKQAHKVTSQQDVTMMSSGAPMQKMGFGLKEAQRFYHLSHLGQRDEIITKRGSPEVNPDW
jgi:hypothetical protein